jgi:hypothetical protein
MRACYRATLHTSARIDCATLCMALRHQGIFRLSTTIAELLNSSKESSQLVANNGAPRRPADARRGEIH